jgi:hypothetical protein
MPKTRFTAIRWARDVPMMIHKKRKDRVAHHILLIMATYAQNNGTDVFVSVDTLARQGLVDLAELDEVLARLVERGYVRSEKASNGADGWALNIHVQHERDEVVESRLERKRASDRERKQRERQQRKDGSHAQISRDGHGELGRDITPELGVTDESVTQNSTVTGADVTQELGVSHAQVGRTSAGQSAVTPLNSQVLTTELHAGTTYRADADASRAEDAPSTPVTFALSEEGKDAPTVIDADIVEDGDRLFDVPTDPAPRKPAKNAKKPRQAKPVDPAKAERARQAQHLATSYHEAMAKMSAFMGVRTVVARALERFTYEQVRDGLKHLATVERHRPLTGQTLLNAIEATTAGVRTATQGNRSTSTPRLSTGDLRWVQGEFLKSSPDWDVLARFGINPTNAHDFGWQQPA